MVFYGNERGVDLRMYFLLVLITFPKTWAVLKEKANGLSCTQSLDCAQLLCRLWVGGSVKSGPVAGELVLVLG